MKLRFFGSPIQLRVVYALIASLLWWAMVEFSQTLSDPYEEYLFKATGAVYGALVLVPYLPSLKGTFKLRALALLLCGVLSYWAAISAADLIPDSAVPKILRDQGDTLVVRYILGISGVVGAVIIGIGTRLFAPLALRWDGWLMLMGAGFLGGLVLSISFFNVNLPVPGIGGGGEGGIRFLYWLPGHIAWQVLVCLALYYGSNRDSGLQRDSSTPDLSPKLSTNKSTNSS